MCTQYTLLLLVTGALVVLFNQLSSKRNVLGLSVGLRGAVQVSPRLPLVLSLQVKHTWLRGVIVTGGGLLVQAVQLQQFVIGRALGQAGNGVGLGLVRYTQQKRKEHTLAVNSAETMIREGVARRTLRRRDTKKWRGRSRADCWVLLCEANGGPTRQGR